MGIIPYRQKKSNASAARPFAPGPPRPRGRARLRQILLYKKSVAFRGGGIGTHRLKRGLLGRLRGHRRGQYHSGYAPPVSFAQLPPTCPLHRRSAQFPPIGFGAKQEGRNRNGPRPRPADPAPGRMGRKGTDGFLCHRPVGPATPGRTRRFPFTFLKKKILGRPFLPC